MSKQTTARAGLRSRVIRAVSLGVAAALPFVATAEAKVPKRQPSLSTTICHGPVFGTGVAKDLKLARRLSLKHWKSRAAGKHSVRFADWGKAKIRRIKRRRDRIEQSWVVTRMGRPCGPRFIMTR